MIKRFFSMNRIDYIFPRILVSSVVFYFFKTAFWPLTYLFIVSYIILVLLFVLQPKRKFKFSNFFLDFILDTVLVAIFIMAVIINWQFSNSIVQKDILLLAVLFSLFYFLYWNNVILQHSIPIRFTLNLIILTTASISILNVAIELFSSILPSIILAKLHISEGPTIANDYNYFCVFIFFGLIILNYNCNNNIFKTGYSRLVVITFNFFFLISIAISGSRRGLVALIILGTIYLTYELYRGLKYFNIKNILKKSISFLLVGFLSLFIIIIFYKIVPKESISNALYKYSSIAGINKNIYIEKLLWKQDFSPPEEKEKLICRNSFNTNPEYWGRTPTPGTTLAKVKTPYGEGIRLIKEGINNEGFSLYYTGPKIFYYANHTYKISFKLKLIKGNFESFNVGWWASDGGKGTSNTLCLDKRVEPIGQGWYVWTSTYTFIDNHVGLLGFINSVMGNTELIISDFELSDLNINSSLPRFLFEAKFYGDIDVWLNEINPPSYYNNSNLIINGSFNYGLNNWKYSADALKLKIVVEDNKTCALISRGNGNGLDWSLYYTGWNINFLRQNQYQLSFKLKPIRPEILPFSVGFWLNEGNGYINNLKLKIDTLNNGWLDVKANYIFKDNQTNLLFPINSQISNSQFFITDIELKNLTQNQVNSFATLLVEKKLQNKNLLESRSTRWLYAIELWETEYKWYNKLFGHGFDYLEWYGNKFTSDEKIKSYDWPHNPFISVLLYSGLIGLALYIWLLYKTIYLYIMYRKSHGIFFIGFLLTFFFSFFSGSSPFDPPIMGFFMLLPFFIHSMHKNEIPLTHEILNDAKNSDNRDK